MQRRGFRVIGISPMSGPSGYVRPAFDRIEGIPIHRYPLTFAADGLASYAREFGAAFLHTARLLQAVARRTRIDVVHAANPPDFLLLAALPLKRRGTRLIFDHHDLSPELYLSRGAGPNAAYRLLGALERLTFRSADVVISTNESFRRIAIERGGKRPEDVFVVRNGPDLSRFELAEPDPSLKRDKRYLLAYAGVMGRQDGIDYAVRALAALHERRQDWRAIFLGDGEMLPEMRELVARLGLDEVVEFAGWQGDDDVMRVLATSDVCLAPDPKTEANDRSTMIKIMEYMALGRPIVSFDLVESLASADAAARFVPANDVGSFARAIDELLDDPQTRAAMGRAGRERVRRELAWQHSERVLHQAYDHLLQR
jgi:glycosyltransferase involved in cell wall biosynthesis